jgi:predicted phosphohydrolase
MSDLHMEGGGYIPVPMQEDKETTLVLAGDIHVGTQAFPSLTDMCDRFKYVIYVFGNHEFYHSSITYVRNWYAEQKKWNKFPDNLFVLDNDTVTLDGVRFIGSTLWTDMGHDPLTIHMADRHMRDFSIIFTSVEKTRLFTPKDSMVQHEAAVFFLEKELKKDIKDTVVITHHLPSYSCVAPRWVGNSMNACFASNLDNLICDYKPEYWIHGHTHDSVREVVDETIIVCNPKGYGQENANNFNPEASFEI